MIKAIVVDDEPLAREGLCQRLQQSTSVQVVGECHCGEQALVSVKQLQPDVLFLDIEMPGMNGIEVLRALQLKPEAMPKVVLVTAYAQFAVEAFEYAAFDYLLKPLSSERIQQCLQKLEVTLAQREALDTQQHLETLLGQRTGKSLHGLISSLEDSQAGGLNQLQQSISLKNGSEWLRIKLDDIVWIQAAGDYMCLHTCQQQHIVRISMSALHDQLDRHQFLRVSRSAIINADKVVRLTPNSNGEYIAYLQHDMQVKVSRKYKLKLAELDLFTRPRD